MNRHLSNDYRGLQGILIPGGGLAVDGSPAAWVCNRLDRAADIYKQCDGKILLMPLSAGTTHKAPPRDQDGYPIYEAAAGTMYLMQKHHIDPGHIRHDMTSLDTIGNAAFARWCLTDPNPALRNLLIITSEFHMPRTQKIFEWVYGLPPAPDGYKLTFETVPNIGLPLEDLQARISKEQGGLASVTKCAQELVTMPTFHQWFFTQHGAYSAMSLTTQRPQLSAAMQRSY